MRIAVSAVVGSLDAEVDPRFGRCPYFVIVDVDTMDFEVLPNPSQFTPSGAGIQAAQTVTNTGAKTGANIVLTGSLGPIAYQALSTTGIQMITGVSGIVGEAVERFKNGQLRQIIPTPNVPLSFETSDASIKRGRGGRQGVGRGGGAGYRRWQSMKSSITPPINPDLTITTSAKSKEQEFQQLKS